MLELAVVIVCYRTADLAIDCLRSIEPEIAPHPGRKVIICENGSGDDTGERLAAGIADEGWGDWVELLPSKINTGFAGGNNIGIRRAFEIGDGPEFVLLLNTDTIVRPGALDELLRAARAHPDAGILGPRLEWPDGKPQRSCFPDGSPIAEMLISARTAPLDRILPFDYGAFEVSEVPGSFAALSFACVLIRREVIEKCGLLDDGYFLYFEDPDYCRRARRAGFRMLYWPEARVVHLRGGSGPVKELTARLKRRPRYWYASRSRYFAKFYGQQGLLAANLLWSLGRGISLLRERLGRKPQHICEREWLDIWTNTLDPLQLPATAEGARR